MRKQKTIFILSLVVLAFFIFINRSFAYEMFYDDGTVAFSCPDIAKNSVAGLEEFEHYLSDGYNILVFQEDAPTSVYGWFVYFLKPGVDVYLDYNVIDRIFFSSNNDFGVRYWCENDGKWNWKNRSTETNEVCFRWFAYQDKPRIFSTIDLRSYSNHDKIYVKRCPIF